MLLTDGDLAAAIDTGELEVSPLAAGAIQPASIDLLLGDEFRTYPAAADGVLDPADVAPVTELHVIRANRQVTLHPGAFLLASTVELVRLGPGLAAQLDGVSTNGRLGLMVHSTAGWVDPGFYGQLTLELSNVNPRWPIVLTPGMRIAQLCVFRCSSPANSPYRGRYQGQTGPWAARSK